MITKLVRITRNTVLCGAICFSLTGCAGTILAGLTISELLTAGSIGSALITGKGFGEHALDLITGQDCRILDAVFREDRAICEPKNSVATNGDFRGLIALLDSPAGQDIQLAEIPYQKDQFPAVNVVAQKNSSLVLAALTRKSVTATARPLRRQVVQHAALTKETATFDIKALRRTSVADVPPTDLRKRLMTKGLF